MNESFMTAYLAPRGFVSQVAAEIPKVTRQIDRLLVTDCPEVSSLWAQNVWRSVEVIKFASIKDAARKLGERQRNWWLYVGEHPRRAKLIQDQLPHVSAKRLNFMAPIPISSLGSWTLLDENTILASTHCTSPYPNGELEFVEDKISPPSRAYLKLWEVFTRLGICPAPGEVCIDLGASPGGWTWVLANLGAQVLAFDRASLDPKLMASPLVQLKQGDAFKIQPDDYPEVTWLFSDMICYPEKLWEFLQPWIHDRRKIKIVCTIKFQGDNPYEVLKDYLSVPGARCLHLYHNKHELTWIRT